MKSARYASMRACLPIEKWPAEDQKLWAKACDLSSPFDEETGRFARLSEASRVVYKKGWGRWVGFLTSFSPGDLDGSQADRCSKENVQAYVDFLFAAGNSVGTVIDRLSELMIVSQAFDQSFNGKMIARRIAVLRTKAQPVRSKSHIKMTNELVDLGFGLMVTAVEESSLSDAAAFRDGLLIAFLALHPVRRRNLANFELGKNLVRQGVGFMIVFRNSETKTRNAHEVPLADVLVEPMNRYLAIWRPILMTGRGRWTRDVGLSVWVSEHGSPLSYEAVATRIEMRTRAAFGKAINPHAFRDAAATTLVIADAARIHCAAPLLGHLSLATTQKHYIQAKGLEAQRSYLDVIDNLKKEKSGG